jgi:hypothetical protein
MNIKWLGQIPHLYTSVLQAEWLRHEHAKQEVGGSVAEPEIINRGGWSNSFNHKITECSLLIEFLHRG